VLECHYPRMAKKFNSAGVFAAGTCVNLVWLEVYGADGTSLAHADTV
jgi:hypothetical protein